MADEMGDFLDAFPGIPEEEVQLALDSLELDQDQQNLALGYAVEDHSEEDDWWSALKMGIEDAED